MSATESIHRQEGIVAGERSAWRLAHLSFALLLVIWLIAYGPTLRSLVTAWLHTGTYQYCVLIFPIVIWLIWTQRRSTGNMPVRPNVWGVCGMAAASVLWLFGALVSADVVQHFSIVAMLPFAVLACYGRAVTWTLIFPLAYLFFAVPYGDFLVEPLRNVTAHFSVKALQLSGATVFLDGRLIEVPVGTFDVAAACSGVKFFIATTALGTLYAYLFYRSWRRRLIFVAVSLIAPIIANGLRVYFTILIGETFGMQYASGTDHLIFGWQFFGTVLFLLFIGGWHWREDPTPTPDAATLSARPPRSSSAILTLTLSAVAALLIGPTINAVTAQTPRAPSSAQRWAPRAILQRADSSIAQRNNVPSLGTHFFNADAYLDGTYGKVATPVALYMAQYFGQPSNAHDVLDFRNKLFADHWRVTASQSQTVAGITLQEIQLQSGDRQRLAWYWYQVDGQTVTGAVRVKLLQVWGRLRHAELRSAVVFLSTPIRVSTDDHAKHARATLSAFVTAHHAKIQALLHGSG